MSAKHNKRVRVITDQVKYARHRRKKLARRLAKVLMWSAIVFMVGYVFWLILDKMLQPPPME